MLSDRSYMRDPQRQSNFTFVTWMLGTMVAVFVLQNILERWFNVFGYYRYVALSADGIRHGYAWTAMSYALVHGGVMHLLLNGLGLFFVGRSLETQLGARSLVQLTIVGLVVSSLFWLGVNFTRPGQVVGASGVFMAYLMVFACLQPHRPMTFLIFFIIPVTLRPFWLVAIVGGIDLMGFLFKELPGGSEGWVAHSAHLGGLAGGWLYYRFYLSRTGNGDSAEIEFPRWMRKSSNRAPAYSVNLSGRSAPAASSNGMTPGGRDQVRAEVDRILDKINERGFGSLTSEEKRVLDSARQVLGPR